MRNNYTRAANHGAGARTRHVVRVQLHLQVHHHRVWLRILRRLAAALQPRGRAVPAGRTAPLPGAPAMHRRAQDKLSLVLISCALIPRLALCRGRTLLVAPRGRIAELAHRCCGRDMSVGKSSLLHQFTDKKCTLGCSSSLCHAVQSWRTSRTRSASSLARESLTCGPAAPQLSLNNHAGEQPEDQAADLGHRGAGAISCRDALVLPRRGRRAARL